MGSNKLLLGVLALVMAGAVAAYYLSKKSDQSGGSSQSSEFVRKWATFTPWMQTARRFGWFMPATLFRPLPWWRRTERYYVLSEDTLAAISPEGKLLSKVAVPGGHFSPTLAADGTLYVPLRTGKVIAFATTHGPLLLSSPWPKFQHDVANSGRAQPI